MRKVWTKERRLPHTLFVLFHLLFITLHTSLLDTGKRRKILSSFIGGWLFPRIDLLRTSTKSSVFILYSSFIQRPLDRLLHRQNSTVVRDWKKKSLTFISFLDQRRLQFGSVDQRLLDSLTKARIPDIFLFFQDFEHGKEQTMHSIPNGEMIPTTMLIESTWEKSVDSL